jgi:hypothetical protein
MPHFIVVETCSFRFPTNISLGLAPFEGGPFLHQISLGLEPQALELFKLFLPWASLLPVPFTFMAWLLVKELVVLLEPRFFIPSHIRKAYHDGLG